MATMVRWSPFQELEQLERRMRSLFETPAALGSQMPAADLVERDADYLLELEVPGFEEKELEVAVTDHTVTVSGSRLEEKEEKEPSYLLHERLERTFERRFTLPEGADTDKLTATYKHGVLTMTVPKAEGEPKRKVEITTG